MFLMCETELTPDFSANLTACQVYSGLFRAI